MNTEAHLEFYRRWHRLNAPYFRWQFEQFERFLGDRCADIGCGIGNFLPCFLDRGFYLGIDNDPELVIELQNQLPDHDGFRALRVDATTPAMAEVLRSFSIDSAICVNVLEHISEDRLVVGNLIDALPVGGTLSILVPALPFLFGTLDTLDGHYRRYTKSTLRELWTGLDVRVERLHYFNFVAIPGWYLKGRILKDTRQTDANYKLMNILLPAVRAAERLVHPPIGLSLVAVLRKTSRVSI